MKTLMNDVISALSALPELHWVDDNLGQLNQEQPAVEYPCALVGIGEANGPYGDFTLEITIACEAPATGNIPPAKIHSLAEEMYNLIQKADLAIRQLEGEQYAPLTGIKITSNKSHFPAHFVLSYTTVVYS